MESCGDEGFGDGCASSFDLDGCVPQSLAAPDGFEDEEVFDGEAFTIDLVFTPDEKLLVVQKEGYVNLWEDPDGDYSYSKKTQILDISDDVCDKQERGLGGIQLHPDFGVINRYVYLYYTYNKNGNCDETADNGPVNRLSRFVMLESFEIDKDTEFVTLRNPFVGESHAQRRQDRVRQRRVPVRDRG